MCDIDIQARLKDWLEQVDDPELSAELQQMEQAYAQGDTSAVADAFFQDLAFGTAGLRGVIGAGTNRMNQYTVARATLGLADYLVAHFEHPSVAIARDSRNKGEFFVKIAAAVLASRGVKAYVYPRIAPTPALSFAVRDLGCSAGINMTASHNPAEYNGYKVYGPDGCQITSEAALEISNAISARDYFNILQNTDFDAGVEEGLIAWIGEDTFDRFIDAVYEQSQEREQGESSSLKVVYTPLNGTGLECVTRILSRIGSVDVTVVPEQAEPDGNFPTCPYPNPESRAALERGIALCEKVHPDLLLATDPDADRVGVACEQGDDYALLTGNEIGVLLMDYIAATRQKRGEDVSQLVAVSTIVSSAMADCVAQHYGFELRRTLTGFKYIGEQITLLEAAGEPERYMFGFEESYGYLAGTHVRDKDAIVASMLICQMARYYRQQNKSLVDAMNDLYESYGYWLNNTISLSYPGADGAQRMDEIMLRLREEETRLIAGAIVNEVVDYQEGIGDLPRANVIEFRLTGGAKVIVRPSGTEPKIKAYLFANEITRDSSEKMLARLEAAVRDMLQ